MKKLILIAFTLTIYCNNYANDIIYKLDKNQKLIGTYSGDIDQKSSIHLIITKNKTTKQHEIIPFYIDETGISNQLQLLKFEKAPSILSYHLNGMNLTLLVSQKIKRKTVLDIIDLNLKTKKNVKKRIQDFNTIDNLIFRLVNKTLLLKFVDSTLSLLEIRNSNELINSETKIKDIKAEHINTLFSSKPEVINLNEFVEKGSVADVKAYFISDDIYLESTDKKTAQSTILTFNINSIENFNNIIINNDVSENTKDSNSYIYGDKIITASVNNEDAIINIVSIKQDKVLKKISLAKDLSQYFSVKSIDKFIKKSKRKAFKPTITANTTIENNILINIDYVDTRSYNYYHDWWFHHQFMMWQNQQMMHQVQHNMPSGGFGPNALIDFYYPYIESKKTNLQFVINNNFKILKNASKETVRKNIDKDKYLDVLKDARDLKFVTASFLNNSYRTIYYSKRLKQIVIKNANLDK